MVKDVAGASRRRCPQNPNLNTTPQPPPRIALTPRIGSDGSQDSDTDYQGDHEVIEKTMSKDSIYSEV
jgi:hypothetical protein